MDKILLGYTRKSIIDGPTDSPGRQRAAIERAAAALGATVEWFEDLDISGFSEKKRPGWQALLATLNKPGVIGVAVESIDRSHRNVREFLDFYDDRLAPRRLRLISATQNLDLSTADGRLTATIIMAFSESESRKASERMRASVAFKQQSLGRHWGVVPFGTQRDKSLNLTASTAYYLLDASTGQAYRADDTTAPAGCEPRYYHDGLRAMFDAYSSGDYSLQELTEYLTAAGWYGWKRDRLTPVAFNRQTVRSILQRWNIYMGEIGPASASPSRQRPRLLGGHQPILPVELCQAVGKVYEQRSIERPKSHSNKSEHNYVLSGLLFCGECGQRLCGQAQHRTPEKWFYRHMYSKAGCSQRITPAKAIEQQVIDALYEVIDNQSYVYQIAERLTVPMVEVDRKEDLEKLTEKREELSRLEEMRLKNLVSWNFYETNYKLLQAQIDELSQIQSLIGLRKGILRMGAFSFGDKDLYREFFSRIEVIDHKVSHVKLVEWLDPVKKLCAESNRLELITQYTLKLKLCDWLVSA